MIMRHLSLLNHQIFKDRTSRYSRVLIRVYLCDSTVCGIDYLGWGNSSSSCSRTPTFMLISSCTRSLAA